VAVRVSADEVGIHSTDDGRRINTIPASSAMDPVSLGKHFASFPSNGVIDIRHSSTGDCIARLTGHAGPLSEVGLSPDGDLLASSSSDGTVRLWQLPEETATSTC
jgi:WD40 repeat protein